VPIAAVLRDFLDQHLLSLGWRDGLLFGVSEVAPCAATALRRAGGDGMEPCRA
jgi:hypothetical protein